MPHTTLKISTSRKVISLIGLLILLTACQPVEPERAVIVRQIVVTATPTITPLPTETATVWLEEVRPTATPLPTPSPGEIKVIVAANKGAAITPVSWHFRNLIASSEDITIFENDGLIEMKYEGYCGDECRFTTRLLLKHVADGELPDFVAHTYTSRDYYDGSRQFQLLEGRVEIDEWDLDGVISGRIVRNDDDYHWPSFEFWHDFSAETLAGRHFAGKLVSTDALRTALQTGSPIEKRSAMLIIRQLRIRSTARMFELVPDLIAAIADTTMFDDDSTGTSLQFIGREAIFTLSALASVRDGTYYANRSPLLDYDFFDGSNASVETIPSPERITEIQANWQALFDVLPDQ